MKVLTDGFTLKIIAIVAMLIDHIGAVLYPNVILLRLIGRLTMPIMAFLIAEGFHYTKNRRKYLARLLIFGVISQLPFMWAFDTGTLNVMFTLALSVLYLIVDESAVNHYAKVLISIVIILVSFWCDWSFIGVLLVLAFYKFRGNFKMQAASFSAVVLIMLMFYAISATGPGYLVNLAVLAALPLLYFYNGKRGRDIKYFFYAFYPAHLLALFIYSAYLS